MSGFALLFVPYLVVNFGVESLILMSIEYRLCTIGLRKAISKVIRDFLRNRAVVG